MKLFIPGSAVVVVSSELYALHRPPAVRDARDGTLYLFPPRQALDDTWYLEVETELALNVHPLADVAPLVATLQPYETAGVLSAGTLAALTARVEALRGQRMVVYKEFPPLFQQPTEAHPEGLALTLEEMIEAGKLEQFNDIIQ